MIARRLATAFVLATGALLLRTKLNCQATQTHPDSSQRAEPQDVSIIPLPATGCGWMRLPNPSPLPDPRVR